MAKLCDANYAGTKKASECTLILTEGDSAKALAIAGLGVVGRDSYGVFPLRGKLLNVRDAKHEQIMKNEEIQIQGVLLAHSKIEDMKGELVSQGRAMWQIFKNQLDQANPKNLSEKSSLSKRKLCYLQSCHSYRMRKPS